MPLNVHQWICSDITTFVRCNCSLIYPQITTGHSAFGLPIDRLAPQVLCQFPPQAVPVSFATYVSGSTYIGSQPRLQYPAYPSYTPTQATMVFPTTPLATHSYHTSQDRPYYKRSANGVPVNTRNGTVRTEARGIFIQNINFHIKQGDLEKLVRKVAKPVRCNLQKDPSSGRFKGYATVQFGSAVEAEMAVRELNGKEHKGMILNVRLDRETTTVEPFVVSSDVHTSARRVPRGTQQSSHY